jgi:hypothetical protein
MPSLPHHVRTWETSRNNNRESDTHDRTENHKQAEKTASAFSGATREFAEQGASFAREASDRSKATAREATLVTGEVSSALTGGALEFNREWIEMIWANTNATFDFAHQLLQAKSPSTAMELTAEHARKQFDAWTEQTQQLASLAQKLATNAAAPMQVGLKSFFGKAA